MEETMKNKTAIKKKNLVVLSASPQWSPSNYAHKFITQTQEFGLGWNLILHYAKNLVSCQVIWKHHLVLETAKSTA